MCTVSWLHHGGGYSLFCNRDEKRTRAMAEGPRVKTRDGVRYISPTDTTAGGTWLATNEFGMSICLLNGGVTAGPGVFESRGLLLPELISAPSLAAAVDRILTLDLSRMAPFTTVILEPASPATVVEWDGTRKTMLGWGELCMPLISSSFDSEGVIEERRQELVRLRIAAGELNERVLSDFHTSHGSAASAYSTCMHRPDAETVSFSRVRVMPAEIEFSYSAGTPCCPSFREIQKVQRVPCNYS